MERWASENVKMSFGSCCPGSLNAKSRAVVLHGPVRAASGQTGFSQAPESNFNFAFVHLSAESNHLNVLLAQLNTAPASLRHEFLFEACHDLSLKLYST